MNYELARLVASAAAKQQTAEVAGQVNGVTAVLTTLYVQVESAPARSLPPRPARRGICPIFK